jgi:hypothetical protein
VIPQGDRTIATPGSLFYPADGVAPQPMHLQIGAPFATEVHPDLDEPLDESWCLLSPAFIGSDFVPIMHMSRTIARADRLDHPIPSFRRLVPDQIVHTVGPFYRQQVLEVFRDSLERSRRGQQEHVSLTFASTGPDENVRQRWFRVRIALEVVQNIDAPSHMWLDWLDDPMHGGLSAMQKARGLGAVPA